MVREIEKTAGIPVVHIATIVPIMMTVGSNRIVPGVAIPHPSGDPSKDRKHDQKIRRELLEMALKAISTDISDQTIFNK